MSGKKSLKNISFKDLESTILKQEIEILKQEKRLERERALKEVATKLAARNMAFPVIRDIVDLPEEELRGIFYGSVGSKGAL